VELSPVHRFVAVVVMVLVLAGLGAYLFLPRSVVAGTSQPPSSLRSTAPSGPRSAAASGSRRPSSRAGQSQPDIYKWLPFTRAGLASAAATTMSFATRYGTYSYTESAQTYIASMRSLAASQLAVALGRAFAAPGVAGPRARTKQVATATAAILSLRAFGQSSLTFVIQLNQRISSTKGTSRRTTDYAVTLTGTGSSWQVNDIQLASAGNL
jgi:hypothetical protein